LTFVHHHEVVRVVLRQAHEHGVSSFDPEVTKAAEKSQILLHFR
jgi:hypothetical protein